jgi:hypothetical protein
MYAPYNGHVPLIGQVCNRYKCPRRVTVSRTGCGGAAPKTVRAQARRWLKRLD